MHFYVIILYVYEYEYVNLKKQYVVQQQFVSMVVQNCCDKDGRLNNLLGIHISLSVFLFLSIFFLSFSLWLLFLCISVSLVLPIFLISFFLPLSISYLGISFESLVYFYICFCRYQWSFFFYTSLNFLLFSFFFISLRVCLYYSHPFSKRLNHAPSYFQAVQSFSAIICLSVSSNLCL